MDVFKYDVIESKDIYTSTSCMCFSRIPVFIFAMEYSEKCFVYVYNLIYLVFTD